jgi:WD40 repeat protein/TPR repeat protein
MHIFGKVARRRSTLSRPARYAFFLLVFGFGTILCGLGRSAPAVDGIGENTSTLAAAYLQVSRLLSTQAEKAADAEDDELAQLIALAALPRDIATPERPLWIGAVSALTRGRSGDRRVALLPNAAASPSLFNPDGQQIITSSSDGSWILSAGDYRRSISLGKSVAIAFAPDGHRLLAIAGDGSATELWDPKTGERVAVLDGAGRVETGVFSPDGARLVTIAATEKTARLWDAHSGAPLAVLEGHTDNVHCVAFSRTGEQIATCSDDQSARLWDGRTGAPIAVLLGHSAEVTAAAFSPDGSKVATASRDGTARVWEMRTGKTLAILKGHTGPVRSVAFSPDGSQILTAAEDYTARLWNPDGYQIELLKDQALRPGKMEPRYARQVSAAYSPDGERILTVFGDGAARLWTAHFAQLFAVLRPAATNDAVLPDYLDEYRQVVSAAFSPDGKRIITDFNDGMAWLWEARRYANLARFETSLTKVEFSPDGQRLLGPYGNVAHIIDAQNGKEVVRLEGHRGDIRRAVFSPDGKRVATASEDNTARLWDSSSGASLLVLEGHTDKILDVAISPDGNRLVTASADGTARLWDAHTGTEIARMPARRGWMLSAMFSPDGTRILTGDFGAVQLWGADGGELLRTLGASHNAKFSPDGGKILTYEFRHSDLWDAASGAHLVSFPQNDFIYDAAFSPDGKRVATGGADRLARVWDAATGALLMAIKHPDSVAGVAFAPDGRRLATLYTAIPQLWEVWPLLTDDTVAYAQMAALRTLSKQERAALFQPDPDRPESEVTFADLGRLSVGEACDRLAGDVNDPRRHGPGLALNAIRPNEALPACQAAVAAAPDELRFRYQLALARVAAKQSEGIEQLKDLANRGYPAAIYLIALSYQKGINVEKDWSKAFDLYKQAAVGGVLPAYSAIAGMYWESADKSPAVTWFERGAELGDSLSHDWLARLYQYGMLVTEDQEQALLHYALETDLYEKLGLEGPAQLARGRRGTLARVLPPETTARVGRAAAAWRPKPPESASATPAEPSWRGFFSADGNLLVLMPGDPQITIEADRHRFKVELGTSFYAAGYHDIPHIDNSTGDPAALLDREQQDTLKDVEGAKLRLSQPAIVDGFPGREIVVDLADGSVATVRYFVAKGRTYWISFVGRNGDEAKPEVVRFLASLHLADRP